MTLVKRFNLRVYALIINDRQQLLLSKERRGTKEFTKFPGGGVELGEGIIDALHRELKEELGVQIESANLFYVNDFFQASSFKPGDQVISFYYKVNLKEPYEVQCEPKFPIGGVNSTDFEHPMWFFLHEITPNLLDFPTDKTVLLRLLSNL